jgi:translation initiation factor 2 subunit 3
MATMLCGANIMDGALLLVAANESCPQPQTREHLQALEIMGMENLIVIQNKIDLVSEEQAEKNHKEIQEFLKGTRFEQAPIIPISALHDINIDVLLQAIQERFRTPPRDPDKHPLFLVARSFDVNKPGALPAQMKGGVIGGALRQGRLRVGDEIEILPGYDVQEKNVKVWKPLRTKVTALMTGGTTVDEAVPGGSVGVGTLLDPSVVKSDKLVGSVAGVPGKLPKVWHELALEVHLLERVVGAKDKLVVEPLKPGELLMLNVYAAATVGIVKDLSKGIVRCTLRRPVCAEQGARVTLSRSVGQRWRLIGWASIK